MANIMALVQEDNYVKPGQRVGNPLSTRGENPRVVQVSQNQQDLAKRMKSAMPAENETPHGSSDRKENLMNKVTKFAKTGEGKVAMGAAGALAAGVAAKKYLGRKKK